MLLFSVLRFYNFKMSIVDFECISVVPSDKRRSKLLPLKNHILFLKQQGYGEKTILLFIQQKGLIVSQQALNAFLKNLTVFNDTHIPDNERLQIMNDLEKFLNEHEPTGKVSRLAPYKDDIFQLKALGYSAQDILLYLKKYKKIEVQAGTLNTFCRREKEKIKSKMEKVANKNTQNNSENLNNENKKKRGKSVKDNITDLQKNPPESGKFKLLSKDELQEYMESL
ncbi:MAG: hypothetical protein J5680_05910 [Neisseriaceae bacterium]|nr:hypothetical protein [Neisseriaceae bacterium]